MNGVHTQRTFEAESDAHLIAAAVTGQLDIPSEPDLDME